MLTIQENQIEEAALLNYSEIYVGDQYAQNVILIHGGRRLAPLVSPDREAPIFTTQAVICVDVPDEAACVRIREKLKSKFAALSK